MDIRNVQKTGNMFYIYLPTSWCKKFNISSDSKVQIWVSSQGKLVVSPILEKKKPKHLEINVDESDLEIINKLIVSCYINPASSFKINLKEKLDQTKLLDQKKLVSIELVEIEGKTITCESSVTVSKPELILKTLINKIRNMLIVATRNYNKELIERYEEEIDRNRLLLDKTIISSLTYSASTDSKPINLFFISQIARDLERLADHIILIENSEKKFFKDVLPLMDKLKNIIDSINEGKFDYHLAIGFAKEVQTLPQISPKKTKDYYKNRVGNYLSNISEVLLDWAMSKELEK